MSNAWVVARSVDKANPMVARPGSRPPPSLVIAAEVFSKDVLMALVEECIVPTLVDEFLRTRMHLPDPAPSAHNETQL